MTKAGVIVMDNRQKVGDIDIDIDDESSADEFGMAVPDRLPPLHGVPGEPIAPRGFGRPSRGTGPLFRPHIGPKTRPKPEGPLFRPRTGPRAEVHRPAHDDPHGPLFRGPREGHPLGIGPRARAEAEELKKGAPESEVQTRGVDPKLVEIVKRGAADFMVNHPGWKWKITSGYSPTHGRPTSMHRIGKALDIQIYEPGRGWLRNIGLGPGTHEFATYHEFALDIARRGRANGVPFSWGGYFRSGDEYDLMHMQEGGPTAYGDIAREAAALPGMAPSAAPSDAEAGPATNTALDTGPPSAVLREERRWIKDELDANPRLKRFLAGVLTHEESAGNRTQVAEALFNRLNALRHTYPDITLSDYLRGKYGQFYGPIRRGEINEEYLRSQVDRYGNDYHEIERALAGSNRVRGFTDQGSRGDPNFLAEYQSGQYVRDRSGELYGDHPGTPHARAYRIEQQRKVEQERGGAPKAAQVEIGVPTGTTPESQKALEDEQRRAKHDADYSRREIGPSQQDKWGDRILGIIGGEQ
jgi:hypothetical protein